MVTNFEEVANTTADGDEVNNDRMLIQLFIFVFYLSLENTLVSL